MRTTFPALAIDSAQRLLQRGALDSAYLRQARNPASTGQSRRVTVFATASCRGAFMRVVYRLVILLCIGGPIVAEDVIASECPVTILNSGLGECVRMTSWTSSCPVTRSSFVQAAPGYVLRDGALALKFGWNRKKAGKLEIYGKRLDGFSPPLRARIPDGYGDIGFQSTAIAFPTPGCWPVTGRIPGGELTFVIIVEKVGTVHQGAMTGDVVGVVGRRRVLCSQRSTGANCFDHLASRQLDVRFKNLKSQFASARNAGLSVTRSTWVWTVCGEIRSCSAMEDCNRLQRIRSARATAKEADLAGQPLALTLTTDRHEGIASRADARDRSARCPVGHLAKDTRGLAR